MPHAVLVTRYAEPYAKLKREIADMTKQLLWESVMTGIRIPKENQNWYFEEINRVITESGCLSKIKTAASRHYDYDEVLDCILELKEKVIEKYWELMETKNV